jgi:hypothetical protein
MLRKQPRMRNVKLKQRKRRRKPVEKLKKQTTRQVILLDLLNAKQ